MDPSHSHRRTRGEVQSLGEGMQTPRLFWEKAEEVAKGGWEGSNVGRTPGKASNSAAARSDSQLGVMEAGSFYEDHLPFLSPSPPWSGDEIPSFQFPKARKKVLSTKMGSCEILSFYTSLPNICAHLTSSTVNNAAGGIVGTA